MGFFFPGQEQDSSPINVAALHSYQCQACPLNTGEQEHPQMDATGSEEPLVYMLGEAPGEAEDEQGKQFVGRSGKYLRKFIPKGWSADIRWNNCVRSRPPKNRDPSWIELECCRPSVAFDIERTKPIAIFGFGLTPLKWITGHTKDISIGGWRGRRFPVMVGSHTCWYYPFFHPSYVVRGQKEDFVTDEEQIFERDLGLAFESVARGDQPEVIPNDRVLERLHLFTGEKESDYRRLKQFLTKMGQSELLGIDIETTTKEKDDWHRNLRPYGKGAKILSISLSDGHDTIAWAVEHEGAKWSRKEIDHITNLFLDLMHDRPEFGFIAHNAPFEVEWLAFTYGKNIAWDITWEDTMAQAYVIDSRSGVLKLNYLIQLYFGFNLKKISNLDPATLADQDVYDVLRYNALDTKWTYHLWHKQEKVINDLDMHEVYFDQIERIPTFVLTQMAGLHTDVKTTKFWDDKLQNEIGSILEQVQELPDVQSYAAMHGEFNPGSPKQVGQLLHDFCGFKEVRVGKSYSTKEAVLQGLDHPLADFVLRLRSNTKMLSTYVQSYYPDARLAIYPDGLIHHILNSCFVATRRSSANDPNMQNFPKQDEYFVAIRGQIVAPVGFRMVCFDYGQIEFKVIGMATGDVRLKRLLTERYDVHTEWAERIATTVPNLFGSWKTIQNDNSLFKEVRYAAKNKLVFPSCFGSTAESIARTLGIDKQDGRKLQRAFFKEFPAIPDWQERTRKQYYQEGYVETLSGYRRPGPMSRDAIINTPIQGSASDIVVDAMNRLSYQAQQQKRPHLQPVVLVHDDLTFYLPEESMDEDIMDILNIMLTTKYKWVDIPLSVEVSEGPDWFNQTNIGTFYSDEK